MLDVSIPSRNLINLYISAPAVTCKICANVEMNQLCYRRKHCAGQVEKTHLVCKVGFGYELSPPCQVLQRALKIFDYVLKFNLN